MAGINNAHGMMSGPGFTGRIGIRIYQYHPSRTKTQSPPKTWPSRLFLPQLNFRPVLGFLRVM